MLHFLTMAFVTVVSQNNLSNGVLWFMLVCLGQFIIQLKKHQNVEPAKDETRNNKQQNFVALRNFFMGNASMKLEWVGDFIFFPSLPKIWSVKLGLPPGCRYYCQSHRVMTLVCNSRGILSLHKHLALSAAVTSWNGSWHKVALEAKNILRRYAA